MITFTIEILEFNEDFVKYEFSTGGRGMSGRKWFPDVKAGQVWDMTCDGSLVKSTRKLSG